MIYYEYCSLSHYHHIVLIYYFYLDSIIDIFTGNITIYKESDW